MLKSNVAVFYTTENQRYTVDVSYLVYKKATHIMKNSFFLLLIGILIISCKPYSSTTKTTTQPMTYSSFRQLQKSYPSADGLIKYIDQGSGPVILLLHGVPSSGWLYRKMITPLVKNGYRVIVPDMLGFGASDSPTGYELYSSKHHSQRLLALMDFLKIDNWAHVMHDAGGLWTWELLAQAPQRINRLILLNTIVFEEGFTPPIRMKPGFLAKTAMWSYRNGITTNMLLNGLFKAGIENNTLTKKDIKGYKTPLLEGKTKGMYYFFSKTCNDLPDYTAVFQKISIPVAVIWGKNDSMLQWEPQKEKIINHLKVAPENIKLLNEKHFIQETKAEKISVAITRFLKANQL